MNAGQKTDDAVRFVRRLQMMAAALLMAAGGLVVFQHCIGLPLRTEVRIAPEDISGPVGLAYVVTGKTFQKELQHRHARARVMENGAGFGTSVKSSQRVKDEGHGRYAFSGKNIWFAAGDDSDPRTNGRSYSIQFPRSVPGAGLVAGILALGAGLLLSCRIAFGQWLWITVWSLTTRVLREEMKSRSAREWSLDMVRALAVFMVLLAHAYPKAYPDPGFPAEISPLISSILTTLATGCWISLDLFFVLSGYLVSGLLFKEYERTGNIRAGQFLCRRGLKIYPAFWVMFLVSLVGIAVSEMPEPGLHLSGSKVDRIIGDLIFLQNYIGCIWNHTWSLAVEEHFYILLAFIFAAAVEGKRQATFSFVPKIFCGIAIGCLTLRCLRHYFMGQASWEDNYYLTHLRIDAIFCGVSMRYWRETRPEAFFSWSRRGVWALPILAAILVSPCFVYRHAESPWITSVGLTTNYIAAACVILSSISWDQWAFLGRLRNPLTMIGRHSYSIYIWHLMIKSWLILPLYEPAQRALGKLGGWCVYFLLYYVATIGLGILLGLMIEDPVLRVRDRYFPSRATVKK